MKIIRRTRNVKNQGFTLIELLVVIAIIGLLTSTILASLRSARIKARDTRRKADVNQVKLALELYYNTANAYPSIGTDDVGYDWAGLGTPLTPSYIARISPDPSGASWHVIQYVRGPVGNSSYGIYMRYEQTGYCKTGVNVNMNWWGAGVPLCQ